MNIIVIRNTEAQSNVNYVVGGRCDEKLTQKGINQAKKLREKLKNIDYDIIISSPVNRAVETAEIINYKQLPLVQDDRITERDPGSFVLKDRNLVNKSDWNSLDKLKTKDNVETLLSLLDRTEEFLNDMKTKYKNKNILLVTHNSISRAIWILIDKKEKSKEEINAYYHRFEELKIYRNI